MRLIPIIAIIAAVLIVGALSCVFIVDERRQALVLEFGRVKRVEQEPGLKFKYPAPINTVEYFDDRILPLETDTLEVTPRDNRRLVVSAFARWRILDPRRFRQSVLTEAAGRDNLKNILNDELRKVLGSVDSDVILSEERGRLMHQIREGARGRASELGVEIVDVRIRQTDLPSQNLKATFDRMAAERQQEAADQVARGKEAAQIIRAEADRRVVELVADARRQAEIVRGEADAERNRIFAEAYGKDPEFFSFYRSLRAYETALKGNNSTMVLAPDSEFFDYLKSDAAPAQ
ncbi:MAG: protease modulator HflC [Neomegalonema sp.]|nr:protease modulator HflC [Neomegalonema sp.]